MNTLQKMKLNYERMSKGERKIADYFLSQQNDISNINIKILADSIGVSQAAISRFVNKQCGETFMDLKIELASIRNEQNSITESRRILKMADDPEQIPNNLIKSIEETCNDVMQTNKIETFNEAVEIINKSKTVFMFGIGASGIIVTDLLQKLMRIGKKCIHNTDSSFSVISSQLVTKDDVVIAVSFSGRTKEVLLAVNEARKNGAKIISITGNVSNPLEKISNIKFYIPSAEYNSVRLAPIFSIYGQLFLVDILFLLLAKSKITNLEDFVSNYQDLAEQLKEK